MQSKTREQLEAENQKLKEVLIEGKQIFNLLNDFLGIEQAAKSNFFAAKLGSMIAKIQRNPQLIENLQNYLTKIKNLNLD